jgi:hypothetical protein
MLRRAAMVINSVDPKEGAEGTVVTLKGSGFARHVRNSCVVVGGMGACARAEPGSSDSELIGGSLRGRLGQGATAAGGSLLRVA